MLYINGNKFYIWFKRKGKKKEKEDEYIQLDVIFLLLNLFVVIFVGKFMLQGLKLYFIFVVRLLLFFVLMIELLK